MDSALWDADGYDLSNGVALCEECQILAMRTQVSPDDLRRAAGIRSVILPDHLDPHLKWDRWGNCIVSKDRREPGELFYLPHVQRNLAEGGVLELFDGRSKYPRTMHLEWSENLQNDDRRLLTEKYFAGEEVVVTEKMDGENTTMTRDYMHARSLDSGYHPSRAWVKQLHGRIQREIPEGWRICGENLFALHAIPYSLTSYFLTFNVWDRGRCFSWDDTVAYASMLGLETVPVLWRGIWDREKLIEIAQQIDVEKCEGYVVRVARAFDAHEFSRVVAKFVRKNHVPPDAHWMERPVIPNKLIENP